MLAVAMSITRGLLKQQGASGIELFTTELVASVTPPAPLSTNLAETMPDLESEEALAGATNTTVGADTSSVSSTATSPVAGKSEGATLAGSVTAENPNAQASRKAVARD